MKNLRHIHFAIIILAAVSLSCSKASPAPSSVDESPAVAVPAPAPNILRNNNILFLEDRIKRDPDDFVANNKLASEYLQRLRETGDITYLNLASRAAKASLDTLPAEQNKGGL